MYKYSQPSPGNISSFALPQVGNCIGKPVGVLVLTCTHIHNRSVPVSTGTVLDTGTNFGICTHTCCRFYLQVGPFDRGEGGEGGEGEGVQASTHTHADNESVCAHVLVCTWRWGV
jgi:hypothetical protein